MLVWQARDRNEWATAIAQALPAASPAPGGPGPFSLADPTVTEGILTAAGFAEVSVTDVHERVYYGADSATAHDAVLRLLGLNDRLADLDAAVAAEARTRLRTTLDAHDTGDGVTFDSRAWLVRARRGPG
jgi:hypothetical protein